MRALIGEAHFRVSGMEWRLLARTPVLAWRCPQSQTARPKAKLLA
jgi:hypothetical protein